MTYETVIGLEVHAELSTASKIFCGCSARFAVEPNTQVCPVCAGMPGALPSLNAKAVEYAVRAGLALHCDIARYSRFDRKNYFYPDLPKAYQISQLYMPLCRNGYFDIELGNNLFKSVGIAELHMEEDAGKLLHGGRDDCTLIDFNRCGVPLIEIVSLPQLSGADEAVAFLTQLRELLVYLGICDGRMQEGSLRADVNVSLRPSGSPRLGVRAELKNMNSFKAIHRAIEYEASRQAELLAAGIAVRQETRRWDDARGVSLAMREKENAGGYRYFPDPDLPPLVLDEAWIRRIQASMPETAAQKRRRYTAGLGLSDNDARVITSAKRLADLFEHTARLCGDPNEAAKLITGEVLRLMRETATPADELELDPAKLAAIIRLSSEGSINRTAARQTLEAVFARDADPAEYIAENALSMVNDRELIYNTVESVVRGNPKTLEDYLAGRQKAFTFLVGQAMKALQGKADPQAVNGALREALKKYT